MVFTRLAWKRLGWAGCLAPALAGGCNIAYYTAKNVINEPIELCDQIHRTQGLRKQAKACWQEVRKQYPRKAFTPEFRDGFIDGYVDYLDRGGNAVVPPVPPKRYTRNDYLTPEGHERIRDYFLGFRYGLDAALATGQRPFLTVPVLLPERGPDGPPTFNIQPAGPHAAVLPEPRPVPATWPGTMPVPTPVPVPIPIRPAPGAPPLSIPPPPGVGAATERPRPQPFAGPTPVPVAVAGATVQPGAATARPVERVVLPAEPRRTPSPPAPVVKGPPPPASSPGSVAPTRWSPPPGAKPGPAPAAAAAKPTAPPSLPEVDPAGSKFAPAGGGPLPAPDPDALPRPYPPLPTIPVLPSSGGVGPEIDLDARLGPPSAEPAGFTVRLPEPPPEVPTLPDHIPTPSVLDELPVVPANHMIPAPLPPNHTIPQRR